jgi:hypothetical protein
MNSTAQPMLDFDPVERVIDGFVIEAGVPIAADKSQRQRLAWEKPNFPFAAMRVGESFTFHPPAHLTLIEAQNLVSGAACTFRKKQKPGTCNFTTRQVGRRFIRCWRVA